MRKTTFIAPRALVTISVLMAQTCLILLRVIYTDPFRNHFLTIIIVRIIIIIFVIILIPLWASSINFPYWSVIVIFIWLSSCFCLSFLLFSLVSAHAIKFCLCVSCHLLIRHRFTSVIYSLLFLWRLMICLFNFRFFVNLTFWLLRWLRFIIYSWWLLFY